MDTDLRSLQDRLAKAHCPHKLYPARLRALEVVTGERLVAQVSQVITMRLANAGARGGWKRQFQGDFDTYGLMEAIIYFHTYPPLAEDFVEDACRLYERLAALYLEHHDEIVDSDDPRVRAQLAVLQRFGDTGQHAFVPVRQPARSAPRGVAKPQRPPALPGYERRLPIHPDLLDLGLAGGVGNFAEELLEHFAARFKFESFPGIQGTFFEVARFLDAYGIDVFGPDGQYVLDTLMGCVRREMFGDFDRWISCVECDESFRPSETLEAVNESLLAGAWLCDECREAAGRSPR